MVPIEIMVAEARKPMTDSVAAPQAFNRTVREDRPEVSPWNLPNLLTMIRLVLAFFLCAAIAWEWWLTGLVIMLFASITDWLDGYLARRLQQSTALGAFLDPVADKLIVATALVLLVSKDSRLVVVLPAIIIIGREIAISALREWMAELGARRKVARKVAAPMNNPAKVRFIRRCCFGVRSRRRTLDASPVYPAMTMRSTQTMVTPRIRYCLISGACGSMN